MDPNSAHQIWSHWTFTVESTGRAPRFALVKENFARWCRARLSSVGQLKCGQRARGVTMVWTLEARLEGVAAHDPDLVRFVEADFAREFVDKGFGPLARATVSVRVLAGDVQDGSPRSQLIVTPKLRLG